MPVLDSNILIYFLNGVLPPEGRARVESWIEEGAFISVITRIEVLGFRQHPDQMRQAERLLDLCAEVPLQDAIVKRTIAVRQAYPIKVPDAIIAATALELGEPLISRNVRDYQRIDGLSILNPFER